MELIWYPGCGGDVSPCSILDRKKFETENLISTSDKRLYIFTDPDQYKMCESAFEKASNIYDCSVEDYSERYSIERKCKINIVDEFEQMIIEGYYNMLSLGDRLCNIIYLKMTMQDYLLCCVKLFELNIKWLFYLKMEGKGGNLFGLYEKCDIPYPEWICANRIDKFGIRKLAALKSMKMNNGTPYYIDVDRNDGCAGVMFGKMYNRTVGLDVSTTKMQLIALLKEMNVLCRDDGKQFDKNESQRVEVIKEKLKNSKYNITIGEIFLLYHKKDLAEYKDDVVLVSTHIDCKKPSGDEGITICFSKLISDNLLLGTYDNSITNTAILYLMMNDKLPENVIVAFTGDEEEDSNGAIKDNNINFKCIVLDVTDAGWDEQVDFTIENNFWGDEMGKRVINTVKKEKIFSNWVFVPEELNNVPDYVENEFVYHTKSEQDESWDYDEKKVKCFSLCIPVYGEMHSDDGVFARVENFEKYTEVLQSLASNIN